MNRNKEHTELVDRAMVAISKIHGVKAIKRDVGCARAMHNPKILIHYGRPGEADIEAVLAPKGRVLYLEAKTGNAVQMPDQKAFEIYMKAVGAQYHVFHSVEEAVSIVNNASRD